MSQWLKLFLQQYLDWAIGGGIDRGQIYTFQPDYGLCDNLIDWVFAYEHVVPSNISSGLLEELSILIISDGLNLHYPFGGRDQYMEESDTETLHQNPQRLEWIRKQLGIISG